MTWNYRLVRYTTKPTKGRPKPHGYVQLHEVYYHKNRAGKWTPDAMTRDACNLVADSRAEMVQILEMMLKDVRKRAPILDADNLPWSKKKRRAKRKP